MSEKLVPQPDCDPACRVNEHVAMVHVADVDRSVEFYALLGFACDSRFSTESGATYFAAVSSGAARLFFVQASGPVDPAQQAVLFYMYSADAHSLRRHLLERGLPDRGKPPSDRSGEEALEQIPPGAAVFEARFPFYMPAGEIRIHDPDGYCILVGQLD